MPLTSDQSATLARQLVIASFAGLNLRQAALLLHEVAGDYRLRPGEGAVIGSDGVRWFEGRMDAVADGIWRAARRPELVVLAWREAVPCPQQNAHGWWGIPELCEACVAVTVDRAGGNAAQP